MVQRKRIDQNQVFDAFSQKSDWQLKPLIIGKLLIILINLAI
jgi:hypothetical protein